MQHEDRIRLQHILDEAAMASEYVEAISELEFSVDGKTQRAIIRSLEVIGEAASKITLEFRIDHPEIPWPQMIGMRNHLIHVYFDIDHQIIWQTVHKNLPQIIRAISRLLK